MNFNYHNKKGFTLLEIIVTLSILAIITYVSVRSFSTISNSQALSKDTNIIASFLEKSRSEALASRNNAEFGVYFSSSSVMFFQGTTHVGSASTTVYNLSGNVKVSGLSFPGGVTEIYFTRLNGEPSATGTITLKLNGQSTTKTMTINNVGAVNIN